MITERELYEQARREAEKTGKFEACGLRIKDAVNDLPLPSGLVSADFYETDLSDFSFLAVQPELKEIRIVCTPLADAECFSHFHALELLQICSTRLSSLAFLRGMELDTLILADNPVEDFSPLYEMRSLKYFGADSRTMGKVDEARLRTLYPGAKIVVNDGLSRSDNAAFGGCGGLYGHHKNRAFPLNLADDIYGQGSVKGVKDEKALTDALEAAFRKRLTEEDAELAERYYRRGESLREIAEAWDLMPFAVRMRHASLLHKLRHPSVSRILKDSLEFANDGKA